jgi:tetratricopeptide (TPR) repeat protein
LNSSNPILQITPINYALNPLWVTVAVYRIINGKFTGRNNSLAFSFPYSSFVSQSALPHSNFLCVINKFNTFLESLPKGDFKQAFELLRQVKDFDNQRKFENFDSQNWGWQEIANWGWQEIAYALETPECFDKTLKLAQKAELYDQELEQLAIIVAQRGRDDQATALANCIQLRSVSCPNQERALTLARIANRVARTGNLIKAANLFSERLQISQGDRDVAMSQAFGDFLGVESRGLSKQNKVLAEMALLAAEENLIDQAIQIAQAIKSESLQAETLAKINSIGSP